MSSSVLNHCTGKATSNRKAAKAKKEVEKKRKRSTILMTELGEALEDAQRGGQLSFISSSVQETGSMKVDKTSYEKKEVTFTHTCRHIYKVRHSCSPQNISPTHILLFFFDLL